MELVTQAPKKAKKKSALFVHFEEYANRATVHGISYIFDKDVPRFDRFLWLIITLGSICLALVMIYTSFTDWQDNQVVITVKSLNKPISQQDFPAVTICAGGKHMGLVEKVLYNNFKIWNETQPRKEETMKERFSEYMKQTFQINDAGISIIDILNMVLAKTEESSNTQIIKQNELACKSNKTDDMNCQGAKESKL